MIYENIEERAKILAIYIIKNKSTVRNAANEFNISKSTVHKDIAERLQKVNKELANEAKKVLELNKNERHIRGGMATKEKYKHKCKI